MSMKIGSTAGYGQLVIIWWYPKDVLFGVPFLFDKYFWIPDISFDIFLYLHLENHMLLLMEEILHHLGCKVPCKY